MRIGGVDFPEQLLNALRDGRLVVFAGAGVSMGPPANLPDFRELARQIAEGTGITIGKDEPEDRFLGQLKAAGTDVHQIAAQRLQHNNPLPKELHRDLLRLYPNAEDIRIVTTNFDLVFEEAVSDLFATGPRIFYAPVLPLGERFQGIVHIHGSVSEPEGMILTHRDFGRAYLTQADGWARRFLVDLFDNHTVLFVGYSHNDTIMNYLTPSLSPDSYDMRYALIGDRSDTPARWRSMGIQPITFPQESESDYSGLDTAVAGLANHRRRRILGWQQEITNIASAPPPIDEESAGVIEHALSTPELSQFFTSAAELPDWIGWLDRRGLLDALFADGNLNDQERILAAWLSGHFALAHDHALFRAIENHGSRLNPEFWKLLSWQMQNSIPDSPDAAVMTRWVLFLSGNVPTKTEEVALSWLSKVCASIGATDSLLRVYEAWTKRLNRVPPSDRWQRSDMFHHDMQELLEDCIKPNLPEIAEPLLALTTTRLNERYQISIAWGESKATWDSDSYSRSAIEPHEQDELGQDLDALIDTARECLDWLAANTPLIAGAWSNRYVSSSAPLLRRLAIHALSARNDLTANDKIAWLLKNCDIQENAAHHEIFRATRMAYPQASREQRTCLIKAVQAFHWPEETEPDKDRRTAYYHLAWLHWLSEADPDCELTRQTIASVRASYPEFQPSEHPDFTHYHWSGWVGEGPSSQSQWDVDMLIARPAAEVLPSLLAYEPTAQQRFEGHDRSAMLRAVRDAAKQNPDWGLDLADAMVEMGLWNSDLWHNVITAWITTDLDADSTRRVLLHLSADELHQGHAREIADTLSVFIRKPQFAETTELLDTASSIAVALRPYAAADPLPKFTRSVGGVPQYVSWIEKATNHASGQLALFWTHSIALWREQQQPAPQSLSTVYRNALDAIVTEDGVSGKFGSTVLAGNFSFFLATDEDWTVHNLLPLFDAEHEDFQCAWDGFLTWGRLSPPAVEVLLEKFLAAVPRVLQEFQGEMLASFARFYVAEMGWVIDGANESWITEFFKYASAEGRKQFAIAIGRHLHNLDDSRRQEWWSVWLKGYWENRLQGVPRPLDDEEIAQMVEWVIHLPGVFPEAASLAVRMRKVPLERSMILYRVGESGLMDKHPNDLAKFLIHLGQCDTQPWFWHRTIDLVERLLAKELPPDIDTGLRELVAENGQWMGG